LLISSQVVRSGPGRDSLSLFIGFLGHAFRHIHAVCQPGAIFLMDRRHLPELLVAATTMYGPPSARSQASTSDAQLAAAEDQACGRTRCAGRPVVR